MKYSKKTTTSVNFAWTYCTGWGCLTLKSRFLEVHCILKKWGKNNIMTKIVICTWENHPDVKKSIWKRRKKFLNLKYARSKRYVIKCLKGFSNPQSMVKPHIFWPWVIKCTTLCMLLSCLLKETSPHVTLLKRVSAQKSCFIKKQKNNNNECQLP